MTAIGVGFVFRASKRVGKILPGLHRVVEVSGDPSSDECPLVVIQIPEPPPPRQIGEKQASYYSRGFRITSVAALCELLNTNMIVEACAPPPPPWWVKSDAQLLEECEKARWVRQGDTWVTPEVKTREEKWSWIQPLVSLAETRKVSSVADLDALVPARAKGLLVGPNQVYDALHRYYAFGETKDALLRNTPKSGGRGQERYAKNGVVRAR